MTSPLLAVLLLSLADAQAPQSAPPPVPAPAAVAADITVDALLDRLEKADADLRTLTAQVVYDRSFFLQGDRHTRFGRIAFRSDPAPDPADPPRRAFILVFDKLFVDGLEKVEGTSWIFDGEWLVEKRVPDKMFTKRRIAPPGERFDPFRVGNDNAMIPLPIGQRKADILSEFKAEIVPSTQTLEEEPNFAEAVKDAYQLHLKPLVRNEKNQFIDIRLWYTRDSFLPLMSRAVNKAGDVSIVQLVGTTLNAEDFPHAQVSTAEPSPQEGYTIQIEDKLPIQEIPVKEAPTP
jgi:hypothetical protein